MMASQDLLGIVVLALVLAQALGYDPSPLQDFCVADAHSPIFVNGLVCKDPKLARPEDFFFSGLDIPRSTANAVGSTVTLINATVLPGLNTLGTSIGRIDYGPYGLNPPHTHPRATEVLTILEGTLLAGFVTSNPENRLFLKTLRKGDVFVFPMGMIHFQFNGAEAPAVALAAFNSQNPGVITIANAVFGSNPRISAGVLEKAFQVDRKVIEELMAQFGNFK